MSQHSTTAQILRLWDHLLPRRKRQLVFLLPLMIIASFAEVISIGALLPFMGVLTVPEKIFTHDLSQPLINLLQLSAAEDLLFPLTLIFILAAIFAGLTRIVLLAAHTHFSMEIGTDFSVRVYESTLYQPYSRHVSLNSSEILAGAQKAKELVPYFIQPVLLICSSFMILLAVIATLVAIHPYMALAALLGFAFIYVAILLLTKRQIAKNSHIIAVRQASVTKAIQEGLGGIRDVLITDTQPFFSNLYRQAFRPMQTAIASNHVLSSAPRFGVEALGVALIASLAYTLTLVGGGDLTSAIPILGALALGAQRLLPLLQQAYYSYITIKGYEASTQDVLDLLDQPVPEHSYVESITPIDFQTAINLRDLGFRYTDQGPWVLRGLNLRILKGSRVGFVGLTGSGKTTLLDIVMGLLTPTEGMLTVDKTPVTPQNTRAWQAHISHVPQEVFLSDASIAENIAFGVPSELIDLQRLRQVAEQAQINKTIESWPNGYRTLVGERGLMLSGGQRQRIGIARALYKHADVVIFDEATSALDTETEAAVVRSLETLGRDITILMIAHRITTLRNCDRIVELADTGIKSIDDYERMTQRMDMTRASI